MDLAERSEKAIKDFDDKKYDKVETFLYFVKGHFSRED